MVVSADGIWLEMANGRRVMDFHGNAAHQVGHGHPRVVAAVQDALGQLPFCPRRYTNPWAIALAERLTDLAPMPDARVLFMPGGAEAISAALVLARIVTGRHKTISIWDSCHRATLEAISAGGQAHFWSGVGPLMPGALQAPPPEPCGCPFPCGDDCDLSCAHFIDQVLEREGDVAAVQAESVHSSSSAASSAYWCALRASCDRHGAMLILDEIPTGLGRTGRVFACEHFDVVPDILVLGKGLGGGVMQLAALLARREWDVVGERAVGHFTHEKSPVACAAGLATLDVIESEDLVARARRLGAHDAARLAELTAQGQRMGRATGIGLLLGLDIARGSAAKPTEVDRAERVLFRCLGWGLSFKLTRGATLDLCPPLTIERADLDRAIDRIASALLAEPECG